MPMATFPWQLPCLADRAALESTGWARYLRSVYGSGAIDAIERANALPFCVGERLWLLYPARLVAAQLKVVEPRRPCDAATLVHPFAYSEPASSYSRGRVLWVHHPRRHRATTPLQSDEWVEVMHCARGGCMRREDAVRLSVPLGVWNHDRARSVTMQGECIEREGKWMYFAPGSGVTISLGRTRAFARHSDAIHELLHRKCRPDPGALGFRRKQGIQCTEDFLELTRAARAAGYDTLQFLGHPDQRCGQMRIEILDVRRGASGSFSPIAGACGRALLRAGWGGIERCQCDPTRPCINCAPVAANATTLPPKVAAPPPPGAVVQPA